jgi:quinoprotein glucose dehydrogenase
LTGAIVALALLVPVFGAAVAAGEDAPSAQAPGPAAGSGTSVWDGVFSPAQAARGKQEYLPACGQCHSEDLLGAMGPALTGPAFMERWNGSTVNDLVQMIRRTMPQEAPDSLEPDVYLDIASYMLTSAGVPTGAVDLPAEPEAMKQVTITSRR